MTAEVGVNPYNIIIISSVLSGIIGVTCYTILWAFKKETPKHSKKSSIPDPDKRCGICGNSKSRDYCNVCNKARDVVRTFKDDLRAKNDKDYIPTEDEALLRSIKYHQNIGPRWDEQHHLSSTKKLYRDYEQYPPEFDKYWDSLRHPTQSNDGLDIHYLEFSPDDYNKFIKFDFYNVITDKREVEHVETPMTKSQIQKYILNKQLKRGVSYPKLMKDTKV